MRVTPVHLHARNVNNAPKELVYQLSAADNDRDDSVYDRVMQAVSNVIGKRPRSSITPAKLRRSRPVGANTGNGSTMRNPSFFGSLHVDPRSPTPYTDATRACVRGQLQVNCESSSISDQTVAAADSRRLDNRQQQQQPQHVRRPLNAFMVWSVIERRRYNEIHPEAHHSEISKLLGRRWKQLTDDERQPYVDEAERLRQLHQRQYPGYKYQPRSRRRQRLATPSAGTAHISSKQRPLRKTPKSKDSFIVVVNKSYSSSSCSSSSNDGRRISGPQSPESGFSSDDFKEMTYVAAGRRPIISPCTVRSIRRRSSGSLSDCVEVDFDDDDDIGDVRNADVDCGIDCLKAFLGSTDSKSSSATPNGLAHPVGASAMYVVGSWPMTPAAACTATAVDSRHVTTSSFSAVDSTDTNYMAIGRSSASPEVLKADTDFGEYCPPEVSEMLIADNWIVTSELDFVEIEATEN